MLTSGISLINFKKKNFSNKIKKKLSFLVKSRIQIIDSLTKSYKYSYKKKTIKKYQKFKNFRVIAMGGSILGTQSIYEFLQHKIKKKFLFINNLQNIDKKQRKNKYLNLVVSKSGNTTETIVNFNILTNNNEKNIFITENKQNYLNTMAKKLKSEIVHHNNYIGGRYSVLSEVGMLPAELMGLKPNKFKQFDSLVKNKKFTNSLINSVGNTLYFIKKRKFNSIIINYDERSESLFKWYQQLVAESLGKKNTGLLPIVSCMPKDNHSVMQLYLDGFKNNFFTFFYSHEKKSDKIKNSKILSSQNYLKNKNISDVIYAQKKATENVFNKKKIPFRSFEINRRDEKTLGELFTFFILETILLGRCLDLNPFDQPSVELIKKETKRILF